MRGTDDGDMESQIRATFDRVIEEHRPALEAAARRLCRTPADAGDLVQDTCERALRHIASLRDERCARAWLVQILRHCYLDGCRRLRPEVLVASPPDPPAAVADTGSPWQRITIEDLHRAIEQLKEPFRSVAILHDVDGLSNEEIAARLGIPYATAATRLHRAHQRLKELLRSILERDEDGE